LLFGEQVERPNFLLGIIVPRGAAEKGNPVVGRRVAFSFAVFFIKEIKIAIRRVLVI